MAKPSMITKSFAFRLKEVSEDGTFEGYASVFGNVDSDNEVVDKGAFRRTIDHNKGVVPILWQHDRAQPAGWNLEAEEDAVGLRVKGRFLLDSEVGRWAHNYIKVGLEAGGKPGLSIGFSIPKDGAYVSEGRRHFKEVKLLEYSVVTFPANTSAVATSAKEGKHMAKDFNSTLAAAQTEEELWDERYTVESAMRETLESICEDAAMSADEKKAAIGTSYGQYATSMGEWYSRYIDAMEPTSEDAGKEEKEGRSISTATAKTLSQAAEYMKDGKTYQRMSQRSYGKGLGILTDLSASGYTANDVNKPNPVGNPRKSESDSDEFHSLLEATRHVAEIVAPRQ